MRKRKKGRKLSRERNQRTALLKTLASSLFLKEKIKTTEAKAKEVSGFAAKFISKARQISDEQNLGGQAKKNITNLTIRRYLLRFFTKKIVRKLIEEIAPISQNRSGGYTKIIKLGARKRDGAKMAIIELVK